MEDYNVDVQYPKDSIFIQDESVLFHTLVNFATYIWWYLFANFRSDVSKKSFIFSTDYCHPDSIKIQERQRRGCGEQFILYGILMSKPNDFKHSSLTTLIKSNWVKYCWKYGGSVAPASRLQKCNEVVIIVEGTAHQLQYSMKQVNFFVYFYFHPNYIPSALSTLQIEVLLSITSWNFTF